MKGKTPILTHGGPHFELP